MVPPGTCRAYNFSRPPYRRGVLARAPHCQLALNPALRGQDKVPSARVRKQIVYGIGYHAAQPAKAVLAPNRHTPHPTKIVEACAFCQGSCFHLRRVELLRCQGAAVSVEPMWNVSRLEKANKPRG